jgi:hypothetical protein
MRGLQDGLQVENVEKVTIIRDRKTGKSPSFVLFLSHSENLFVGVVVGWECLCF